MDLIVLGTSTYCSDSGQINDSANGGGDSNILVSWAATPAVTLASYNGARRYTGQDTGQWGGLSVKCSHNHFIETRGGL